MLELQDVQRLIDILLGLPPAVAYILIATGSAVENIFPPVPSDTFVILGVGGIMGHKEGGQACVARMIEHESAHPFPEVPIKFGKGFVEEKASW